MSTTVPTSTLPNLFVTAVPASSCLFAHVYFKPVTASTPCTTAQRGSSAEDDDGVPFDGLNLCPEFAARQATAQQYYPGGPGLLVQAPTTMSGGRTLLTVQGSSNTETVTLTHFDVAPWASDT